MSSKVNETDTEFFEPVEALPKGGGGRTGFSSKVLQNFVDSEYTRVKLKANVLAAYKTPSAARSALYAALRKKEYAKSLRIRRYGDDIYLEKLS